MSTVTEVVDSYVRALADTDPDAAQALGHRPELLFADLSPDAFAERAELARTAGARAAAAVSSPATSALRAAFTERMASEVALYDVGFTRRLLAPLATPVHLARQVFDNLPRTDEQGWAVVAEHLRALPHVLRQYEATLRLAAGEGHLVARRQVLAVAEQCETWTGSDDFYHRLVQSYPGGRLDTELTAGAGAATAATNEFAGFLRTDLAPRASTTDGVGRELYAVTASGFLGAEVDLDELYGYGWAELASTTRELRQVAAELGHDDGASAMAALNADPRWRVAAGAPLEEWLRERVGRITDDLDGEHFDLPAATRQVECHLSPAASGVMYYTPPDPGLTRAGGIWWSVPPGATSIPVWQDVATLCHEGLPGHHLQFAITLTTQELHPWQRVLCHVHGYAEGWAHYAERLADELGLYQGPAERLGMLTGQLWRAARIVIDIGLHLGLPIPTGNGFTDAARWQPDVAVDFLVRVAGLDPHLARFEVDRYLGWPAQALAFKAGARLWQEARADVERRGSFDRKRFHLAALRLGPMGLAPLRDCLSTMDV